MAEAIVRAAATTGLNGLVDDATGYAKVRARQAAQRDLLAFIAEDIGSMGVAVPQGVLGRAGSAGGHAGEAVVGRVGA